MWLWINLSIVVAFLVFVVVQGHVWRRQERRALESSMGNAAKRREQAAKRRDLAAKRSEEVEALARAAGNLGDLRVELGSVSIDSTDSRGRTALHIAYFKGDEQAVENLIALGADQGARNSRRLCPHEMGMVREALIRLKRLARPGSHSEGKAAIQFLLDLPLAPYLEAVRRYLDGSAESYTTVIRIGREGSESLLAMDLGRRSSSDYPMRYVSRSDYEGRPDPAEVLLNCGNSYLSEYAETWARRRGLTIVMSAGWHGATWGAH